ncbi:MAG: hypothetical protein WCT05_09450 [Lentisphaeria bacterium]
MPFRIWRSPYTRFGGLNSLCPDDCSDETMTAVDTYTDQQLQKIAENGFNAIWVHGVTANLIQHELFPEFGHHAHKHMERLQELIRHAARFGLKVFLYYQPVRSVAAANYSFWKHHADCRGQKEMATEQVLEENRDQEIEMYCLCTSVPRVKQWVQAGASQIAAQLPGLGGVLLITGSEYPGHCYSHRVKRNPGEWTPLIECPRCQEREPWEVAAELIKLVYTGIREHSQSMEIIAWNWGWTNWLPAPCRPMLELLPRDVILMACCERGGTFDFAERPAHPINEYSLIYAGPSEVCQKTLQSAQELGMRSMVKLQLGTTHELGTVLNLPMLNSIFQKASWLRKHPDIGFMGCWNFGNFSSANTFAFNYFLRAETTDDKKAALSAFAESYFPGCKSSLMLRAWDMFSEASKHFPFAIPFMYRGVQTHALSYREIFRPGALTGQPVGCSYLHTPDRGDDLSGSVCMAPHEFSLNELIAALGKLTVLWQAGTRLFAEALPESSHFHLELGNAIVVGCIWQSTENAYKAYRLRQHWSATHQIELRHIILSELAAVQTALPWVERDRRLGWHGEAHQRMFDPESMQQKVEFLQEQLRAISEF